MIVAKIYMISFLEDDYKQTVAYQRAGKDLAKNGTKLIKAVIADNDIQASKMLRKNFLTYILEDTILNNEAMFKYFSFTISYTEVKNNIFSEYNWDGYAKEYSLVGEME